MNKSEIVVDGVTFVVDDIYWEYAQFDGEQAGRSEDGTMYRDVIGLTNKVYCEFKDKDKWRGATLSNLLKLIEKTSCSFNYFDLKENARVTKNMYIVSDAAKATLINDEFVLKDTLQIRFIQMNTDDI